MDSRASRSLTSALLIAIFGTGLVLERDDSFNARPSPPSGRAAGSEGLEGLTSYLWEDPLRIDDSGQGTLDQKSSLALRPEIDADGQAGGPRYHLMMVMMRGEHWPENAEERLRTRFAVNAALAAQDFVPTYPGRIYEQKIAFGDDQTASELPVRFEWFQRTESGAQGEEKASPSYVKVEWINESIVQKAPWRSLKAVIEATRTADEAADWKISVVGPRSSDSLAQLVGALLKKSSVAAEDEMRAGLKDKADAERLVPDSDQREIGPAMGSSEKKARTGLPEIRFFAGTPTVPLKDLISQSQVKELERQLGAMGTREDLCKLEHSLYFPASATTGGQPVVIYRTTTLDNTLVRGILDELKLRGVGLRDSPDDAVVILAEQDSSYGRAWRDAFAKEIVRDWKPESKLPTNFVFKTWLRGLDGVLPGGSGGDKLQERATGQRQLDYVTRLGNELVEREETIALDGGEIKAIGILGVDVYDKLLLLRELKSRFPRAYFFVTDLDARLFSRESLTFTRNLLVASHFGLQFGGDFASPTAPFRGAYQSATYLATYMALQDQVNPEIIDKMEPHIYEIARGGPYDLSPQRQDSNRLLPKIPLGHSDWSPKRVALAVLVFLIGLVFLGSIFNRFRVTVLDAIGTMRSSRMSWIMVLGFVGILVLIGVDSSRPGGEPFLFVGGISVWPSFLLQIATGCFAIYLTRHALRISRSLRQELLPSLPLEDQKALGAQERAYAGTAAGLPILADSSWPMKKRASWYTRCLWLHVREFWTQIRYLHEFSTRGSLDSCSLSKKTTLDSVSCASPTSSRAMQILLLLLNTRRRMYRVCGMTVVFFAFGLILFKLSHFPGIPYRGPVSRIALALSVAFAVATTNFLVLFVFDATQLARRAITHLQNVSWSDEAASHWCPEYQNDQRPSDALVSMRVTSHLAATTERFIYYPFLGLLMMIVARSSIFDNWAWPWPLLVLLSTAFGLAFLAGLLLRNASKQLRQTQLNSIQSRIDSLHRSTQSGMSNSTEVVRLKEAREEIEGSNTGPFGSWLAHPALQAALIPFGGMGTLNLLQAILR